MTEDIGVGQRAVEALDDEHAGVRSAFWLYYRDASEYRLVLALPAVDKGGPEVGYKLVQRALAKHSVPLPIWRVVVVGVREPLTKAIRRASAGAPSHGARLGRQIVDGVTIDDAYVYRSK